MATDKKEKLQKILEQIERENAVISKAKDNIKRLTVQKKKLEKAIQDDEFAMIRSSLEENGITSVEEFNRHFSNNGISQNQKSGDDSSLDPIL